MECIANLECTSIQCVSIWGNAACWDGLNDSGSASVNCYGASRWAESGKLSRLCKGKGFTCRATIRIGDAVSGGCSSLYKVANT